MGEARSIDHFVDLNKMVCAKGFVHFDVRAWAFCPRWLHQAAFAIDSSPGMNTGVMLTSAACFSFGAASWLLGIAAFDFGRHVWDWDAE